MADLTNATPMTVPGLPPDWPELLADALAHMNDDGFEIVWRQLGKTVHFLVRERRAMAQEVGCPWPSPP